MVLLKENSRFYLVMHLIFQFHYGTIKRQRLDKMNRTALLFQFHYGTIKSIEFFYDNGDFDLFQFHYGTIKSMCCGYLRIGHTEFQFHYGTIKRNVPTRPDMGDGNFNPTMVRLKAQLVMLSSPRRHISIPLWYD